MQLKVQATAKSYRFMNEEWRWRAVARLVHPNIYAYANVIPRNNKPLPLDDDGQIRPPGTLQLEKARIVPPNIDS